MTNTSIFTRILAGEIPGDILAETERAFALRDIAPQAPLHVLVIPKSAEHRNVTELAAADPGLLAELVGLAQRIADEHAGGEYRLLFNTGEGVGQTVPHVHGHVLAGDLSEAALVG